MEPADQLQFDIKFNGIFLNYDYSKHKFGIV